ncbi:similar to Saccharomyces cerevisiae YNL125C ESBP6 Protein with similarity to monocarboxylate permeases [Maudiozyma barnettii]|uniref:Similar to Saccharomyces cerevisiae YNL125C ESBP6 Protein with similarity to monocarboxylate permeases n=1 Tax=Maudiozyma barnettii TaxID=61262 RepID=A0A8H2VBP4_9SACH|nr:Esbp6p [Kazachstania barnettii]CAB4252313.1 similar to Saccharomyces cerevisiae YNL125C ESBP6 Protein with similarity to monocarboxylate permeases [Kazachstania barnettii]CAD1779045.1 similar to Saccharomyces cerevisiae YNL125C ESBP6 Protein with similarity to monocarboxylate permeases [Kazachstania barnettii]
MSFSSNHNNNINNNYLETSSNVVSSSNNSSSNIESIASSETQGYPQVMPITSVRSRLSFQSAISNLSRIPSLAKTISKAYTDIRDAVQDDNKQTDATYSSQDLNRLLESRFDLGDALRLHNESIESSVEEESKNKKMAVEDIEKQQNEPLDLLSSNTSSLVSSYAESPLSLASHQEMTTKDDNGNDINLTTTENGEMLAKVFTNKSTGQIELPPDKGYAWVVVFSVFLIMFNTWGCNSAFGVFLSFFLSNNRFPGATRYDYALIAGLTVFLGQGLCPFVVIIMRIVGLKTTMYFGTCVMVTAFVLASYATKLWHLYVTQGFMIGCSISLIFSPATTLLPGWFLKKRAVSMGLSLLGTGAGGVTFGLASNKMIQDFGNTKMCYRMLAITCSIATAIAISLVKERSPIKPVGIKSFTKMKREFNKMFSWKVISQPFVPLIAIWFTLALFGYNLMIFTLSSYAVARGMSQHQGSSLTAILNGAQCVGRPVMGLLGDRFGRANVTITLTCVLCIFMFGFWIPAHTYVQLIFFAIMVGSCVGVANVMNTVLIADMVKPDEFLPAWAFVNYSGAPALLVTEVVAQALTDSKNKSNPYLHTQIFAGCCFSAALFMIFILREYAVRLKLTKRQEDTARKLHEKEEESSGDLQTVSEHWDVLEKRETKYEVLLGSGVKKYFMRMAYPMKV